MFAKHLGELPLAIDVPEREIASAPDLVRAVIERSSREAPEVYRLAWRYSSETLRDGVYGHEYDGAKGDDPDAYVLHTPEAEQAMRDFYAIQQRGLRRAVTAVREWQRRFPGKPHDPVPALVAYHDAAAQRRSSYKPEATGSPGIAWGYPGAIVGLLLVTGVMVLRQKRRR